MTKCGGKNVFNDISKCGSLPLDSAFKNYNMKGGDSVIESGEKVLNKMVKDGIVLVNDKGSNPLQKVKSFIGGGESNGYYLGVGENTIGGRSEVVPYSTCKSPVFNTSCRDLRGGNKRKSRLNKRSRKSGKSRRRTRRSRTRRSRKSRRSRSRTRRHKRHKRHRGGGVDPYNLSGLPSNFSPDMTTRQFGCKAPYWQPKCV